MTARHRYGGRPIASDVALALVVAAQLELEQLNVDAARAAREDGLTGEAAGARALETLEQLGVDAIPRRVQAAQSRRRRGSRGLLVGRGGQGMTPEKRAGKVGRYARLSSTPHFTHDFDPDGPPDWPDRDPERREPFLEDGPHVDEISDGPHVDEIPELER